MGHGVRQDWSPHLDLQPSSLCSLNNASESGLKSMMHWPFSCFHLYLLYTTGQPFIWYKADTRSSIRTFQLSSIEIFIWCRLWLLHQLPSVVHLCLAALG